MTKGHKNSPETILKMSLAKKGKKYSDEHRKNIGLARLRKKLSEETKRKIGLSGLGRTSGMKGKNQSVESRMKTSIALLGKNAPNWKGGITKKNHIIRESIEYRLWREAVFARDNWTCQKTKKRGVELHSHHINNFSEFPELRFAIDNGITLSKEAHKEFHKIYGNKNNTGLQLLEYLKIKNYEN